MKQYLKLLLIGAGMAFMGGVYAQDDGPDVVIEKQTVLDIVDFHDYEDYLFTPVAILPEVFVPEKITNYHVVAVIGDEHTKVSWPVKFRYRCRSNC